MSINDGKVTLFKKISNMCSNESPPIKEKYPIIKEWGREESFNDGRFFANNTAPGYSYSTVNVFKEVKPNLQANLVGSDIKDKHSLADGMIYEAKGVAAQDKISQIRAANRLLQRFNNPSAAEYVLGRKLTADEILSKSVSGPPEGAHPAEVSIAQAPVIPTRATLDGVMEIIKQLPPDQQKQLEEERLKENAPQDELESLLQGSASVNLKSYEDAIDASEDPSEISAIADDIATDMGFKNSGELFNARFTAETALTKGAQRPRNETEAIANMKRLAEIVKSNGFKSLKDFTDAKTLFLMITRRLKQIEKGKPSEPSSPSESSPSTGKEEAKGTFYSRNELRTLPIADIKNILKQVKPGNMKMSRFNGLNKEELIDYIKVLGQDQNVIVGEGLKIFPRKVRKIAPKKPKQKSSPAEDIEFAKEKLKLLVGSIDAGDIPNKTLTNQLSTVIDYLLFHDAIPKSLAVKITKKVLSKSK